MGDALNMEAKTMKKNNVGPFIILLKVSSTISSYQPLYLFYFFGFYFYFSPVGSWCLDPTDFQFFSWSIVNNLFICEVIALFCTHTQAVGMLLSSA